ncbi:MAG: hypothetical protein KAS60_07560, partial [Thermoplasmata archaeon]|nr:hypothetical protein [Thermoplasmata archaeon]
TDVPEISPAKRLLPPPRPILTQMAPLPRVFHGMFGFSRTNLGYPIKSKSSNSLMISDTRYVVHIPDRESVSSTPM